jgi:hypothetical protein
VEKFGVQIKTELSNIGMNHVPASFCEKVALKINCDFTWNFKSGKEHESFALR